MASREHPCKEPSRHFLDRVRADEIEASTSTEVLQEILHRYAGLGRLDLADRVYHLFLHVVPVVFPVTLADTDRARGLLKEIRGISVRDALHAAVMKNHDVSRIATFDKGFDAIPGIERVPLD